MSARRREIAEILGAHAAAVKAGTHVREMTDFIDKIVGVAPDRGGERWWYDDAPSVTGSNDHG